MSDNPASWQPDPTGKHDHRYWDGTKWTDNVADAGVASTDPLDAVAAAPDEVAEVPAAEAAAADAPATEPEAPAATPGDEPTVVTPIEATDNTASYPTAAAPPPYVPPTPVPDGGGNRNDKRGLVIGGAILVAVAIAVIAFLVMGNDDEPKEAVADRSDTTTSTTTDDGPESREDPGGADDFGDIDGLSEDALASVYKDMFDLSDDQAECLAGKIIDAMDDGSLSEDQATTQVFEYLSDCDISLEDIGGAN
jgi:hypothetical protein